MAGYDEKSTATASNKWDARYQAKTDPGEACWVLRNNLHLLPTVGRSLDLACGLGANSLCLAEHKLDSHAWDASSVALEKLTTFAAQRALTVTTLQRDIEQQPPEHNSFDVIVVSQFLYRPMMKDLISALKPDGLLFYQTFTQQKLSSSGPNNEAFLLAPNELLTLLQPLQLVFYREDSHNGDPTLGLRDCSYYIGKKPR